MSDQLTFPGMPGPEQGPGVPPEKPWRGADKRRTKRQRDLINGGFHPLGLALAGPLRLHPQAAEQGRTCGNCRFREIVGHHSRSYPKCVIDKGPHAQTWASDAAPRYSAGPGTDVRRWWPGCVDHEWGDPSLSPDAARSGPPVDDTDE